MVNGDRLLIFLGETMSTALAEPQVVACPFPELEDSYWIPVGISLAKAPPHTLGCIYTTPEGALFGAAANSHQFHHNGEDPVKVSEQEALVGAKENGLAGIAIMELLGDRLVLLRKVLL